MRQFRVSNLAKGTASRRLVLRCRFRSRVPALQARQARQALQALAGPVTPAAGAEDGPGGEGLSLNRTRYEQHAWPWFDIFLVAEIWR